MIGFGILVALTLAITIAWLYVELVDLSGTAGNAPDDEAEPEA
ncbi:MAG: hypothetical protein ABEJ94_10715 [Halorientalis sp.]